MHITHPTISSIHVNFLSSNKVMEDCHTVHLCPQTGAALLSVIDGHGGSLCSEHIKQSITTHVADHLSRTEVNVKLLDIFDNHEGELSHMSHISAMRDPDTEKIREELKNSFVNLDNEISQEALDAIKIKQVGTGYNQRQQNIQRALTGACVNALLLYGRDIFIANTGDCRSVLGRKKKDNSWVSIPLSTDHTFQNRNEVGRIMKEHPGEEHTVFKYARLLGTLMPLRSFGDVSLKWREDQLRAIGEYILPGYRTPPYLTAEPEVTHQQLTNHDKFVVIATDGLWDCLTNEQVVNIVGNMFNQHSDDNIATGLIKQALGGDDYSVYNLIKLRPPESRDYRDDITTIVVTFK